MAYPNSEKDDALPYIVIAAIDFGTTFSGYSFGFKGKDGILINRNWGSELGHQSYKAPTSVLVGPSDEFVSFGYEAEQDFASEEKGSDADHHLFRHFKMKLHDDNIHLKNNIASTTGKEMPALDIFVMAIKYLKEHMLSTVQAAHVSVLKESHIKWVITVPAIWKEESKYFMREVAFKAGMIADLDSEQLVIALEPEAASIYCRSLKVDQFKTDSMQTGDVSFETGEQYLVVDAGGGTVDITAHEVMYMGRVKEIYPPTGGPWGGKYVDDKFSQFIEKLLGSAFVSSYKFNFPKDWMNFMLLFEKTKASHKVEKCKGMNIPISYSFGVAFNKFYDKDIEKYMADTAMEGVEFKTGHLVFDDEVVQSFYKEVIHKTVHHIKKLLTEPKMSLKYILFVGGFGECDLLQKAVLEAFSSKVLVIIPHEAQLAIMKGAVIFGQKPEMVVSRIARLTYGLAMSMPFNASIHDVDKRFKDRGKWYCTNIFKTIIAKGDEIKGSFSWKTKLGILECIYRAGKNDITLYTSHNPEVMYTTDTGVEMIGKLTVYHNKNAPIDESGTDVWFHLGGTEIIVQAQSTTGGEKVKTVLDFSCSLID